MVSASLGVLQSDLIQFKPQLPVSSYFFMPYIISELSIDLCSSISVIALSHVFPAFDDLSAMEGFGDLPVRHGRVHQDLRQVPQEVLA
jgi:hypothetical protein